MHILFYLILGAFAGTLSGLLGIGGGAIVVPALVYIFAHHQDIPAGFEIKMAIGTSLATMILTLSASLYAHHKRQAVKWSMVKVILPGLTIGVVLGALLVRILPTLYLKVFFSCFLLVISLKLLLAKKKNLVTEPAIKIFPYYIMVMCAFIIGVLSSLLGTAGGIMWVPFFLYSNLKMNEAIGTSVACGIVVAILGSMGFLLLGSSVHMGAWSTGYIFWPAVAGISATSILFAPLGAYLAQRLPNELLKKIFALLLLCVAIDMIFFTK